MPEKPQKVWVDSQISHLELLNQIVAKLPANERLDWNDSPDLTFEQFHAKLVKKDI